MADERKSESTSEPGKSSQNEAAGTGEQAAEQSFSAIFEHLTKAANIAAALGEEKAQKLFAEMQGHVSKASQKGQQAARKAKEQVADKAAEVEDRLAQLVASTLARVRVATRDDIERLEKLIREVRDEVGAQNRRG